MCMDNYIYIECNALRDECNYLADEIPGIVYCIGY